MLCPIFAHVKFNRERTAALMRHLAARIRSAVTAHRSASATFPRIPCFAAVHLI